MKLLGPHCSRGPLLLCLLSGLFGGLLFHHNWLGLLAWVALVPYFMALRSLRGKAVFWGTMLFGCTWYYLGLWWLHTLVVFSWLVPLGVVVGVAYISLYFLLFAYPAAWCMRNLRVGFQPWAIATCWVAVEYLRNFTDMAFPWNLLGHSQVPFNWYHTRSVSISGISVVSFAIALVNAGLATAILQIKAQPLRRLAVRQLLPAGMFALLFPLLNMGVAPLDFSLSEKLKVSIIQPGISQLVRWNAMMGLPGQSDQDWLRAYHDTQSLMEERIDMLSRQAGNDHPDLIVLPESPFLVDRFPYQTVLHNGLQNLARDTSATLFLGADYFMPRADYDKFAQGGQRFLGELEKPEALILPVAKTRLNDQGTTEILPDTEPMVSLVSAYQISPQRGVEPYVYNKMQLVPFGENIPFIGGIDWLVNALDASGIAGRFRPGMQNTVFEVNGYRYGAVICFESTFSYLTRRLENAGAKFICVLTNDSWYDPAYAMEQGGFWGTLFRVPGLHQLAAAGPRQHFIHSQLRAIETRLPVVRSANTGISSVIDMYGRVKNEIGYGEAGWLTEDISINAYNDSPGAPMAARYGDWFSLLCAGIWFATWIALLRSCRQGRSTDK